MKYKLFLFCFLFVGLQCNAFSKEIIRDVPFSQEYHDAYPIQTGKESNDVRAIAIDSKETVWAATGAGLYVLQEEKWIHRDEVAEGPVFDLFTDDAGILWVGAWDGLYRIEKNQIQKIPEINGPVSAIGGCEKNLLVLGPEIAWQQQNGKWKSIKKQWCSRIRSVAMDKDGSFWIGTALGLYHKTDHGVRYYYKSDELYSSEIAALRFAPDGRLWISELGGIDIYENGVPVQTLTAKDGLPNFDVRSISFAPDGQTWIATALGIVRTNGKDWSLRHSRRWLLSDDVRDIAFDKNGTAWIATANGVSAIKTRQMTLKDKADYYLELCLKRHVREPWIVEKCYFPDPANKNVYQVKDDDNDGSYTAYYMVMECLRYAVTKDPEAKLNADKAFDFIEYLQTVTSTKGFVARTIIPSDSKEMADPNRTYTPQEKAAAQVLDYRDKPVEKRWRLSADGKWLWKGDTSSDEITGHLFGYLLYYDLAADAERKERVKKLVAKIMDGIIDGGYVLRDIDGTHTRWGVWSPEKLNHDSDWRVERPINSFEILSYLKAAYHITNNQKYQDEYKELITKHGYAENARRPKSYERADRTHIDDELLMFAAPALLLYENDPELSAIYKEAFTWVYRTVENDHNPFFNFMFGFLGGENAHVEDCVSFLRDQPLDLTQWMVDNSKREDIQWLRVPMMEPLQTNRMLPPSERGVMRWDKNPWEVISGDFYDAEGRLESSGVFWLMPYWLGRYCGYISEP